MNGSHLILFRDDSRKEVFLVRRNDFPVWQITGGGIEEDEAKEEAALREAFEETGFDVALKEFLGKVDLHSFSGKLLRTGYIYEGRVISGEFVPEFEGCKGKWFNANFLPYNASDFTKRVIKQITSSGEFPFLLHYKHHDILSNLHLILRYPYRSFKMILKMR